MTQQEAARLARRIAREMPAVQATLKEHIGRKGATPWWSIKATHQKLQLVLPVMDTEDWQSIRYVWGLLDQKRKAA